MVLDLEHDCHEVAVVVHYHHFHLCIVHLLYLIQLVDLVRCTSIYLKNLKRSAQLWHNPEHRRLHSYNMFFYMHHQIHNCNIILNILSFYIFQTAEVSSWYPFCLSPRTERNRSSEKKNKYAKDYSPVQLTCPLIYDLLTNGYFLLMNAVLIMTLGAKIMCGICILRLCYGYIRVCILLYRITYYASLCSYLFSMPLFILLYTAFCLCVLICSLERQENTPYFVPSKENS